MSWLFALLGFFHAASAHAKPLPPAALLSEKTTSESVDGEGCPKKFIFQFKFKALADGPIDYRFVRSDGDVSNPRLIELKKGKPFNLQEVWELDRSVDHAWLGVRFGDGKAVRSPIFALKCPRKTRKSPQPAPSELPSAVASVSPQPSPTAEEDSGTPVPEPTEE